MRGPTAKDVMSKPVVVVRWDASIPEIVRTMRSHSISGVPVVDEFGLLAGIVSETDLVVASIFGVEGRRAQDIMARRVVTADESTPVGDIARTMMRNHINRVPIVDGEELLGIITRADVLSVFDSARSQVEEMPA